VATTRAKRVAGSLREWVGKCEVSKYSERG
jgi:hypothetical protein